MFLSNIHIGIGLSLVLSSLSLSIESHAQRALLPDIVLPNNSSGHVLDLVLRYGRQRQADVPYLATPRGIILGSDVGDLELCGIEIVALATPEQGPRYTLTVRNNSNRRICDLHVSLVAVFDRLHRNCPTRCERAPEIGPHESVQVEVELPIGCLGMGRLNGESLGFRTLIAAIDSYDEYVESNEANNLLIVKREAIPAAMSLPSEEVVAASNLSNPEPQPQDVEETVPIPQPVEPKAPGTIDLDQLDFGDGE